MFSDVSFSSPGVFEQCDCGLPDVLGVQGMCSTRDDPKAKWMRSSNSVGRRGTPLPSGRMFEQTNSLHRQNRSTPTDGVKPAQPEPSSDRARAITVQPVFSQVLNMSIFRKTTYGPIGVTVGRRKVRIAQVSSRNDQLAVHALAEGQLRLGHSTRQDSRDRDLVDLIRQLVKQHRFKGRTAVTCLKSDQLFVQNVLTPSLSDEEIEKIVQLEAEEKLKHLSSQFQIRHAPSGVVRDGDKSTLDVMLIACRTDQVERKIQLLEAAGLKPQSIDLEACAVSRSLAIEHAVPTICVHLGRQSCFVADANSRAPRCMKHVRSGGEALESVVERVLGDDSEAFSSGGPATQVVDPCRAVMQAARPALQAVTTAIQSVLRSLVQGHSSDAAPKIFLTGTDATPFVAGLIGRELNLTCELGDPFLAFRSHQPDSVPSKRCWRWCGAVGLSLR